jgi:two-component system nitrogen regulation response regulator NtrX
VRVLAATNKNLADEIAAGTFREDLYYRLNVLQLEVPPLREREGDVNLLVPFFMDYFADIHGHRPKRIDPKVLEVLRQYQWPGNIRELKNIVERMMIMASGDGIMLRDVPPAILQSVNASAGPPAPQGNAEGLLELGGTFRDAKDAFERAYLRGQLERNGWNISRTAEAIKLERSNLHKKIKQLRIEMG